MRRRASAATLIEDQQIVAFRVEQPAMGRRSAGTGTAVQEDGRLAIRVAAKLPVEAVPVADVEVSLPVGLDGWVEGGRGHGGGAVLVFGHRKVLALASGRVMPLVGEAKVQLSAAWRLRQGSASRRVRFGYGVVPAPFPGLRFEDRSNRALLGSVIKAVPQRLAFGCLTSLPCRQHGRATHLADRREKL